MGVRNTSLNKSNQKEENKISVAKRGRPKSIVRTNSNASL